MAAGGGGGGAETSKLPDVAGASMPDVILSVCAPLPVMTRFANVATPFTAVAASVPDSTPVPLAIDTVTGSFHDVTTLPFASRICATGCGANAAPDIAPPGCVTIATAVAGGGGGGLTVIVARPVTPSLTATRSEVPAATPTTIPVAVSTVATSGLLELPVIVRPVRILLLESRSIALAVVVSPTSMTESPSVTVTEATGAGCGGGGGGGATTGPTVSVAEPFTPSNTATIAAVPLRSPRTLPEMRPTEATEASLESHLTERPVMTLPAASSRIAMAFVRPPTSMRDDPNVTAIVSSATAEGVVPSPPWSSLVPTAVGESGFVQVIVARTAPATAKARVARKRANALIAACLVRQ